MLTREAMPAGGTRWIGQPHDPVDVDVLVVGAGSSGIAASIAAAQTGARTLLIDASPLPGGELISGISMLGCMSTRGDWIVGGIVRQLLDRVAAMDGYIGPVFDFRSLWLVCFDHEVMRLAVFDALRAAGVTTWLYTFAAGVRVDDAGRMNAVTVLNKRGFTDVRARIVIDCSGDADVVAAAGGPFELGAPASGAVQPPTLIFRMSGVNTAQLLDAVVADPEGFGLAEFPGIGLDRDACARALRDQGQPKVVLLSDRGRLKEAIDNGEMFPTSILAVVPVSPARREVSINCTQIANVVGTDTPKLSRAVGDLHAQVGQTAAFLKRRLPGFQGATYSGAASKVGVRETRRIVGERVLTESDVLEARRPGDGVALGGHELDLFAVTSHRRQTIRDGGAYGIAWGCLVPKGLSNVLVAGRCLSSTREAQSSARVMGTCMAMGHAVGTAAAVLARADQPTRSMDVAALRAALREQGALVD